jgi:hypothetical protein
MMAPVKAMAHPLLAVIRWNPMVLPPVTKDDDVSNRQAFVFVASDAAFCRGISAKGHIFDHT